MTRSVGRRIASAWIGWYLLILFLVFITIPPSTTDSHVYLLIPLILVPFGAYDIARCGATPGMAFIYGCGAFLLFVPHLFLIRMATYWSENLSTVVAVLPWLGAALVMGAVCHGVAMMAIAEER